MRLSRPLLALLTILFLARPCYAQSFVVKGAVTDTLNANRLRYSSVTLIRAADSILETFTRSAEDGSFLLRTNHEGKYLLLVTFPGFADYLDIVSVDKDRPVADMGIIPMVSRSHLLSEFVLRQQIGAIKIKGDTTEYVADSFKVRDNATVEELLKKLPGIQVNKNGEVVAQGEKVQKILVDGEEFFTDDPAVVTKSLQAKAVDKVQVFDKKSDETLFTGIDDGTREKTINLSLKDNMKKGYFGRVNAGGGTDGFFENQAMINAFRGKRKLSAFGIAANTGKVGLGWEDKDKFGGGNNMNFTDGDMTYFVSSDDEFETWNGKFNGQGLPSAWTGGLHYSNKWMEDRLHLSSNYRYAKQNIETTGNTLTETVLSDARLYRDEQRTSYSFGQRHRGDLLYEWKVDSSSQLKLTANASISETRSGSQEYKTSFYETDTLNDNHIRTSNDLASRGLNASLLYQKKFRKTGRTMAITLDESYREVEGTGYLFSEARFYTPDSTQIIDQRKDTRTSNLQLSGKVSYTEPLSSKVFLEVNYQGTVSNNSAKRLSFDKNPTDGDFDQLNDTTSSNYDFNYLINTGGANLRFVYKKYNFSFGGSVSNTNFRQRDNLLTGQNFSFTRSYNNFFPQAAFSYRVAGKHKSFRFNYNGSTRQPTMEQIQPLVQNTDPTRLVIGNENLRQEFMHSIRLNYNDYKILSGTYTYLGVGFNLVNDAISRAQTISSNGQIVHQYVNVNGNYNSWMYGGLGKDIKKLNLRAGFSVNANFGRVVSYVNGQQNISNNNNYGLRLNLDYDKDKVCNISFVPGIFYNQNTATLNTQQTNYWSFEHRLEGNVTLPFRFEIGTDIRWYLRERVAQFDNNNNVFLWNAYLSRKFLKGDQLELVASVNDILNQNLGFQRFATGNMVTEQNYNTIRRYGMLSLIWNFTKAPSGTPASGSNMRIKD